MATNYNFDIKELKKKVGVVDIAASLGYVVKEKPGNATARVWSEMVAYDGAGVVDTIVIKNANNPDRSDQIYVRAGRGRGDVISFIRENIARLCPDIGTEWKRVCNVMSDFAENPRKEAAQAYQAIGNSSYKFDFEKLREQVGVIDVAIVLGYKINEQAGSLIRSRWIEMVKGPLSNPIDTIVVSNSNDKGKQGYFRRNNTKGTVITLIRDHINELHHGTGNEWMRVGEVLCDFAGRPRPEVEAVYQRINGERKVSRELDVDRYKVKPLDYMQMRRLFNDRGLSESTAIAFSPFLVEIKDLNMEKYQGYNLGFPYCEPGQTKVVGYEIRGGKGFKSMAAGTNSSSATWMADFAALNGKPASRVYCFESAFDAMAFYQRNQQEAADAVLVSIGGQMSAMQIKNLMEHYHGARFVDCFDNDAAGRAYGVNLALIQSGTLGSAQREKDGTVAVEIDGQRKVLTINEANAAGLKKHFGIASSVELRSAPAGFKDWNDVVLGNRMEPRVVENKYVVNTNLAERVPLQG